MQELEQRKSDGWLSTLLWEECQEARANGDRAVVAAFRFLSHTTVVFETPHVSWCTQWGCCDPSMPGSRCVALQRSLLHLYPKIRPVQMHVLIRRLHFPVA